MTTTTTQLTEVADFIKTAMDFPRFARLTQALGNQVNHAQLRFLKAMIFESAMEVYSQGLIAYVGEEGCDLIIESLGKVRVEMKYTQDALYTRKGKQLRETTGGIKLMNSLGTNTHQGLPQGYADFLIFIGSQGAILFDKPTVAKYTKCGGDGIAATIPVSEGILLATPSEMNAGVQREQDFIGGLKNMIAAYIRGVK